MFLWLFATRVWLIWFWINIELRFANCIGGTMAAVVVLLVLLLLRLLLMLLLLLLLLLFLLLVLLLLLVMFAAAAAVVVDPSCCQVGVHSVSLQQALVQRVRELNIKTSPTPEPKKVVFGAPADHKEPLSDNKANSNWLSRMPGIPGKVKYDR